MADEYTITLTVREADGGVEIRQRNQLGRCDNAASIVAHAISDSVTKAVCGVQDKASKAATEINKSRQTIH